MEEPPRGEKKGGNQFTHIVESQNMILVALMGCQANQMRSLCTNLDVMLIRFSCANEALQSWCIFILKTDQCDHKTGCVGYLRQQWSQIQWILVHRRSFICWCCCCVQPRNKLACSFLRLMRHGNRVCLMGPVVSQLRPRLGIIQQ